MEERKEGRVRMLLLYFLYSTGYLWYVSNTINYFGVWYLRRTKVGMGGLLAKRG